MIEHNFKKKFGQNFINDNNIINKIIDASNVEKDSLIIEIGPGAGALTKKLVEKGKVLAYEIDTDLEGYLLETFKDYENIDFIFEDFLDRDIKEDIKKYSYSKLYVIANLPYYITTPIINKIISSGINIYKIVIMVQKEVGDRFCAKVGTKDYSSITVFLNYYFDIKKEFVVSRNAFYPRPNVDSIVISLTRKNNNYEVKDENKLFELIRESFKYKRKNLKNNLKKYDFAKIEHVLNTFGMDQNARAEQLTLEQFIEISNVI